MKKAWQIWSLFFLCLVAVAGAMLWLSLKTIRLDALRETDRAETEVARREAELQERISSALYRMDLKMLPLVAQEAARPPEFYRSFYDIVPPTVPGKGSSKTDNNLAGNLRLASPLLFQSSEFVQLYFEIDATNSITSPKYPQDKERDEAIDAYQVRETVLDETLAKMNVAQKLFDYPTLFRKTTVTAAAELANNVTGSQNLLTLNAYQVPAVENFRNSDQSQTEALSDNIIHVQRSRSNKRINADFNNRRDSTTEVANQSLLNNGFNNALVAGFNTEALTAATPTHPMQPVWLGEHLIMARQAVSGKSRVIQCCWLDWEGIKTELQSEVAELLPELKFEAVASDAELKIGTALTTIPVQLNIDRPKMLATLALDSPDAGIKSGFPIPLLTAWGCLGLAALASALLLRGVMRLSERRAAFVSAVTHELRTPLTTFRMYSEMLADGMVPPEKQQQYASTLKVQADRLSHLVENVLQFARLERGPVKIVNESVTAGDLLDRCRSRMLERAADSQMQLVIEVEESISNVLLVTQPAAIEQILFNLVDNACKYAHAADDNRIVISVDQSSRHIRFHVRDFGPGITSVDRKRIFEPFRQSEKATADAVSGVGLGLALCQRMARSLGGRLIAKESSAGAWFELELPLAKSG